MAVLVGAVRMFLGLSIMALTVAVFMPVCIILLPSRAARVRLTNLFGRVAGAGALWAAGVSYPKGIREQMAAVGPAVFVSNHTSINDIFLASMASPSGTCGVAKKEVVFYPFFGQLYWLSGHLRIDRSNARAALMAIKETAAFVKKHGFSLFMWPEGTRSRDGRLLPFKKGVAHLAMHAGLPLVPVVVAGAHKGWEKGSMLIKACTVTVKVLPPIDTSQWKGRDLDKHMEALTETFNRELPPDQQMSTTTPPAGADSAEDEPRGALVTAAA